MSNTGWIKLHRKITDHWLWEDKPFARGQAMIDLLILARYNDQSKYIDGNLETVERGSVVTSIRRLCDRWGWSNSKVVKFLKTLENDSIIHVKSDTKKTVKNNNKYNNNNIKRFTPPDCEQVSRYCQQRHNGIDPEEFVDYYTAKDWMIGNSKMQDWKAAVRNWERNQAKKNAKQKSKTTNLSRLECDRDYDFGALERQLFEKQMTG